jgi:hypothetical protein
VSLVHVAANGSAPSSACERAGRRLSLALVAALLAAGCVTVPAQGPVLDPAAARAKALAAAEAEARVASGFVGVWAARFAPGEHAARAVTLELRADGVAELRAVYLGRGVDADRGRWSAAGDGLRVAWDVRPDGSVRAPMAWLRSEGRLLPSEWDHAAWGESGLAFTRWEPSRPAQAGCAWRPYADATLGVRLLVQSCDGALRRFASRGAEIVDRSDASGGPRGTPILQVFGKGPEQGIDKAIRERFFPQLVPRVRAGCVVRRGGGIDPAESDKEIWTIGPTEKYREETAKWRAAEPSAMVCGPYGERDGVGYFEFHPGESRTRYLFVWLGSESPAFDEHSIELLD